MTEPGDCRNCKQWKGCLGKLYRCGDETTEWYHYGEIRWCPRQVIWIVQCKQTIRDHGWPNDPYGPSDASSPTGTIQTEASFVKPHLIIAELEVRLQRVGRQAELLITQIEDGRTMTNLSDGAWEVLMYLKGWRRKKLGFRKWLREVYHRRKTGEKGLFSAEKAAI